jgi:UDP-glucose:glycoprotein glucosyltransferase
VFHARLRFTQRATHIVNSESVALENPDAFFPFLNTLANSEMFQSLENLSPDAIYNKTLQTAVSGGYIPDPGSLAAVEFNLALHAATPKIEAFYQHYTDNQSANRTTSAIQSDECQSWIDWYGETVCDVETLARLVGVEDIESANKSSASE